MPANQNITDSPDKFTFYSRSEYFDELCRRARALKTNDKLILTSMSFRPEEPEVMEVIDALCAAAKRGADVRLSIDAHAFMADNGILLGPLFFYSKMPKRMPASFRARLTPLEKLKKAGGSYVILNQPKRPFTSPYAGRSHIKFCVINDRVFIAGCNLSSPSIDLVTSWHDPRVARYLTDFADGLFKAGNVKELLNAEDQSVRIDDQATLLIDSGVKNQSIILTRTLELIHSAKEYVYITCQFFPDNRLVSALEDAHWRGVDVRLVFNNPRKHDMPSNVLHTVAEGLQRLHRDKALFSNQLPKANQFLHAKLLATEQAAMMGSHNFVNAGVAFGTAEMSLYSTDPHFARGALKKIKGQIN